MFAQTVAPARKPEGQPVAGIGTAAFETFQQPGIFELHCPTPAPAAKDELTAFHPFPGTPKGPGLQVRIAVPAIAPFAGLKADGGENAALPIIESTLP